MWQPYWILMSGSVRNYRCVFTCGHTVKVQSSDGTMTLIFLLFCFDFKTNVKLKKSVWFYGPVMSVAFRRLAICCVDITGGLRILSPYLSLFGSRFRSWAVSRPPSDCSVPSLWRTSSSCSSTLSGHWWPGAYYWQRHLNALVWMVCADVISMWLTHPILICASNNPRRVSLLRKIDLKMGINTC